MSGAICDVCGGQAIGVACGACGPVSYAYCKECLTLRAEPFQGLAAYLACGGLVEEFMVIPAYLSIVEATCARVGKTKEEFWALVVSIAKEMDDEYDSYNRGAHE